MWFMNCIGCVQLPWLILFSVLLYSIHFIHRPGAFASVWFYTDCLILNIEYIWLISGMDSMFSNFHFFFQFNIYNNFTSHMHGPRYYAFGRETEKKKLRIYSQNANKMRITFHSLEFQRSLYANPYRRKINMAGIFFAVDQNTLTYSLCWRSEYFSGLNCV